MTIPDISWKSFPEQPIPHFGQGFLYLIMQDDYNISIAAADDGKLWVAGEDVTAYVRLWAHFYGPTNEQVTAAMAAPPVPRPDDVLGNLDNIIGPDGKPTLAFTQAFVAQMAQAANISEQDMLEQLAIELNCTPDQVYEQMREKQAEHEQTQTDQTETQA